MQTYRHALDRNTEITDIFDVVERGASYTCLGCGLPMIAKPFGLLRDKHFAHRTDNACDGETYLHILAKNVFYFAFKEAKRLGTPLTLHLPRQLVCPLGAERGLRCCAEPTIWTQHNLVSIYTEILMEKKHGPFIPDLLLSNPATGAKLFVEILVSSPVSQAKLDSGIRIMEIAVPDEHSLTSIRAGIFKPLFTVTYNFRVDKRAKEIPSGCQFLPKPPPPASPPPNLSGTVFISDTDIGTLSAPAAEYRPAHSVQSLMDMLAERRARREGTGADDGS